MIQQTTLTKAIAIAIAGSSLALGSIGTASAHTMYNRFVGAADSSTDGWVYGNTNGQHPNVTPGWVGTASATTLPFGYNGAAWLNWAAEVHSAGETLHISKADAFSRYTVNVDIDTNKGSWNDDGQTGFGTPQGWAHNTDIGLIKSEESTLITLNLTNVEGTWNQFGITVFEGYATNTDPEAINHHATWNCPNCGVPSNYNDAPFELQGLTYVAHDNSVTSTHGLQFLAEAGKVYSVFLGGRDFGSVFAPTADYDLKITAAPVPVPAAFWLFGSAVAGLLGIKRRLG